MPSASDIRLLVLRAMADDYEQFDSIAKDVKGWAREARNIADDQSILDALEELVTRGYVRVYCPENGKPVPTQFSRSELRSLWFFPTSEGRFFLDEAGKN